MEQQSLDIQNSFIDVTVITIEMSPKVVSSIPMTISPCRLLSSFERSILKICRNHCMPSCEERAAFSVRRMQMSLVIKKESKKDKQRKRHVQHE